MALREMVVSAMILWSAQLIFHGTEEIRKIRDRLVACVPVDRQNHSTAVRVCNPLEVGGKCPNVGVKCDLGYPVVAPPRTGTMHRHSSADPGPT
jgi:hypothetical protein